MKFVVFFSDGTPNPALLGGKGSNLLKLTKIGVNVPLGFIISTDSYRKFLEESKYKTQLNELLIRAVQPKEVLKHSAEIQDIILKSPLSEELTNEVKSAYKHIRSIIGKEVSFAVRSSANIEDSTKFSFAGQADSFLYNNTFKNIIHSLKKCWASLFSPRALLYFLQMKKKGMDISLKDIQMAVVVQKMVNSEISIVMFTANVVNNNQNQMMINSTWGLGETIADNSVNPDTIIINKEKFEIIKVIIGEKEKKSIRHPKSSGTIMVVNDSDARKLCSLNEMQLQKLHKLGLKLEESFNCPQDIELAIEKENIYVLQTRPITTLRK